MLQNWPALRLQRDATKKLNQKQILLMRPNCLSFSQINLSEKLMIVSTATSSHKQAKTQEDKPAHAPGVIRENLVAFHSKQRRADTGTTHIILFLI